MCPCARTALVAFLIGLLYPLYTITGFDASAHTSEETRDARRAVPRGMIHSVFWSLVFGFVMALSFVLASPDLAATAKDGAAAWFNLFNNLPAPTPLKDVIGDLHRDRELHLRAGRSYFDVAYDLRLRP